MLLESGSLGTLRSIQKSEVRRRSIPKKKMPLKINILRISLQILPESKQQIRSFLKGQSRENFIHNGEFICVEIRRNIRNIYESELMHTEETWNESRLSSVKTIKQLSKRLDNVIFSFLPIIH